MQEDTVRKSVEGSPGGGRSSAREGRNRPPTELESGARPDLDSDHPQSPADLSKPSLVAVIKRARVEFGTDHLTDLAAALTYYGVLSIVPALIVLVAALGLLGKDTTDQAIAQVQAIASGSRTPDMVRKSARGQGRVLTS